ncbi:MAG: cysteine dioxygenase family protein [Wenzhouxiangellaceae bacterium]|nr:cysteine dioxygenase family protein [Wenzhouxiangellaceae bacterium]
MDDKTLEFDGKRRLIQHLDAAMDGECAETITQCIRDLLCKLMEERALNLPACVYDCPDEHYARRLIHKDAQRGYTVMAMTWGPGQATPIHDHSGMWCVEAVWNGQIEVTQYELTEAREHRYRLEPRTTMRAGIGSAGSLIPPHEYHTIRNPSARETAVTIHIYSGEMNQCAVFHRERDDWHTRQSCELHLDAA